MSTNNISITFTATKSKKWKYEILSYKLLQIKYRGHGKG